MNIKCHVYQAKNGLIYLSCGDGRVCSALTLQQVADLGLAFAILLELTECLCMGIFSFLLYSGMPVPCSLIIKEEGWRCKEVSRNEETSTTSKA